jgi:phosphopantetheinyl transferase (holo-ACP synthase)
VLGPHEIEVFRARRAELHERGVRYLATRFSAKEAFAKAIGLGMRVPMTWRSARSSSRRAASRRSACTARSRAGAPNAA